MKGRSSKAVLMLGAAATLAACHGSSNSSSYTIGGTISGLNAGSVVLVNGTSTVTVSTGATTWSFPSAFAANSSYSVAVLEQPAGELCEVTSGGTGATLTGDLSDVTVVCSDYGQWIWQGGLNVVNASGVYGTLGAASVSNVPGGRYSASSWTDPSGNFWLFGGVGYDAAGTSGNLNDLWEYSPSTGLWTWMNGSSGDDAIGVYGTLGTAAATNVPGARYSASSWADSSGNLWLFGGVGYDATGSVTKLNDLWRFSPVTNQWTWISGGNIGDTAGVYGTEGTAAAGNVPGARYSAVSWIDSSGNLWLFGGYGYDAVGHVGNLNDLWRFTPSTGLWTWISGGNVDNAIGVYGTQEVAVASNVPGARQAATGWIDSAGNLFLFGGVGYDASGSVGSLNDLWEYSVTYGVWAWISGGSVENASGVYGTQGTPAVGNVPGARQAANSWIDSAGNLFLFGGVGYDANGDAGDLNDLWEYSPATREWNWVNGANGDNANSVYGTQGTASSNDAPGGRQAANAWIDSSGKLWLFGGAGYGATGNGYLDDLWQFLPP